MADQGKKASVTKKESMATNGKKNQPIMESQTKGKGKQRLTNGISQTSPTSGMMNQVQIMEQTAMVGNRTRFTMHSTKVSKPNRLQGSHHPTAEMRLEGFTPMPLSEET